MNKKGLAPLIVTIIIALIVGAGAVGYQLAQIKGKKIITSVPTTIITTTSTKNKISDTDSTTPASSVIPLIYN